MGYRSDGKLAIKKTDLVKAELLLSIPTPSLLGECELEESDGIYFYSYVALKMYDSYPEVEEFQNWLNTLKDKEIPYEYIRLGESYDDVEKQGDVLDYMYVHRSIERF